MNEHVEQLEDVHPTLTFDGYQEMAAETAIYPVEYARVYPALGLAGEAGEVANKVKKEIRDGVPVDKNVIADEIGDNLWYLAALARDYDLSLNAIASRNLDKLFDRKNRGVLGGSGDTR